MNGVFEGLLIFLRNSNLPVTSYFQFFHFLVLVNFVRDGVKFSRLLELFCQPATKKS